MEDRPLSPEQGEVLMEKQCNVDVWCRKCGGHLFTIPANEAMGPVTQACKRCGEDKMEQKLKQKCSLNGSK